MNFANIIFLLTAVGGTALGQANCAPDSCISAIKNDRRGKQDCNSNLRQTVTPTVFTSTSTITITGSETSTTTLVDLTSTTLTLTFSETIVSTITETPSVTVSTTSTIQPFAGAGGFSKRDEDYVGHFAAPTGASTSDFVAVVARAAAVKKLSHFSSSVKVDKTYVQRHIGLHNPQVPRAGRISPSYSGRCASMPQYLSACTCAGAAPVTTTLVQISTTITEFAYTTLSFVETTLTTDLRSFSESTTATESTATTTTTTSTSTFSTSILASPTCTSFLKGPNAQYVYDYRLEYAGFKTLNPNNPGNSDARVPPVQQIYSGTYSACAAADLCTSYAGSSFTPIGTGAYFAINLQLRTASQDWLCVIYYDQTPATFYNVASPGISQSFGWTKRP